MNCVTQQIGTCMQNSFLDEQCPSVADFDFCETFFPPQYERNAFYSATYRKVFIAMSNLNSYYRKKSEQTTGTQSL